jgi:hypothetical protein
VVVDTTLVSISLCYTEGTHAHNTKVVVEDTVEEDTTLVIPTHFKL